MEITPEILEIIERIVNILAPKYVFAYYDLDDIKQEGRILAIQALSRYDERKNKGQGLDGFLYTHVCNRYKNLMRDKGGYMLGHNKRRQVIEMEQLEADLEGVLEGAEEEVGREFSELVEKIDMALEVKFRADWVKFMQGIYIPRQRKNKLLNRIREILNG